MSNPMLFVADIADQKPCQSIQQFRPNASMESSVQAVEQPLRSEE
jgi:hypothetical protein